MGDRVLVVAEALADEIAETNHCLQKRIDGARSCVSALGAYCEETRVAGAAYANSQEYYANTYIPLLNQVAYACEEIIERNNTIMPTFEKYVPDTQGFAADTVVLEEEIERLQNENLNFQEQIEYYSREMIPEPPYYYAPDYTGIILWYQFRIGLNNHTIDKLQEVIDGLRTFNSECADMYSENRALLNKLSSAIAQLKVASGWNSNANRYVIPSLLQDKLSDIEYEKMVINNPDGSITLNSEYVSSVLQQEAVPGTPAEIIATYLALIETFENISTSEDMETFLNACYIKREIEEPDPADYSGDMASAYEYWHRQPMVHDGVHFEFSLSPVFKEMTNYYNRNVVPDILTELHNCTGLYSEDELVNKLTRSGILQNLAIYGDQTYSRNGNSTFHPITVQMEEYQIEMHIASSGSQVGEHDIVQYCYSSGLTNAFIGKEIEIDYIQKATKTWQKYCVKELEDYGVEKLADGLGMLCPEYAAGIKGGAAAITFLDGLYKAYAESEAAQDKINEITFTDAMAAFGLDGQLCVVDGQLQCQYLQLNSETFLQNFAAHNVHINSPGRTIDELCSSPEEIEKYILFYTNDIINGAVQDIAEESYEGNVDEMIRENVSETDQNYLEQSIIEQLTVIDGGAQ